MIIRQSSSAGRHACPLAADALRDERRILWDAHSYHNAYRISAFPIQLPALRERREDLPILAESLLARLAPERSLRLNRAAHAWLMAYDFPGNIRELRNLLERAVLLTDGDEIGPEHFLAEQSPAQPGVTVPDAAGEILPLELAESRYIHWALAQVGGDKRALAQRLGISERTLYRKLQT